MYERRRHCDVLLDDDVVLCVAYMFFSSIILFITSASINPFNASCSKLLLFEGFSAILVLWFLISDIWAVWHSGLSIGVPECQKLEMVG